jgi:metallo-beta-lactamase family protein
MHITFHGAAGTVTGSQHLIEVNGYRILLDCGLYQGRRKAMITRNRNLPFNPAEIDRVILSHAHIDHSGNLPNLIKSGYGGEVLMTGATRDLCQSMLPDSGHIQERNAEYANRHRKENEAPAEAIYTEEDARAALERFRAVPFNQSQEILPGVQLTMIEAGHMLGSATVILDIQEQGREHSRRIVFSGDIGRPDIPIIRDPVSPDHANILIMESTYGGRTHDTREDVRAQLKRVVQETFERGGSIIIPAFAVGRTQQIVVHLNELVESGELPALPVFVDSPLATNVTEAFRNNPDCYDSELVDFLNEYNDDDPFGFRNLSYVRSVDESKALNDREDSIIIISASGMIEFGRVVHHLVRRVEDPRHTLLVTGWQAPHTLGRKMVDGAKQVRIFGREYKNRIQTVVLNGFSGHADHDELLQWVDRIDSKPKRVFLVHGEPEAAEALKDGLTERYDRMRVDIPQMDQRFEVS